MGLGTFLPPSCKSFLVRDGVLNLLCSDPGILKPTERFTGWKQKSSEDSLFALRDGHSASSRVVKATYCTWALMAEEDGISPETS